MAVTVNYSRSTKAAGHNQYYRPHETSADLGYMKTRHGIVVLWFWERNGRYWMMANLVDLAGMDHLKYLTNDAEWDRGSIDDAIEEHLLIPLD